MSDANVIPSIFLEGETIEGERILLRRSQRNDAVIQ